MKAEVQGILTFTCPKGLEETFASLKSHEGALKGQDFWPGRMVLALVANSGYQLWGLRMMLFWGVN